MPMDIEVSCLVIANIILFVNVSNFFKQKKLHYDI